MALSADVATAQLDEIIERFARRHRDLLEMMDTRAAEVNSALEPHAILSVTQRRLVGAYFLNEYSFKSTALFNPSIVANPDQSGAPAGGCRIILSLRGVGEGHISSLSFRTGSVAADGTVSVDTRSELAQTPRVRGRSPALNGEQIEVVFRPDSDLSERVIFPVSEAQRNGIEDARFVEFDDNGRKTFMATYTAYSGQAIRSELLETSDFLSFRLTPLAGSAARNKGMALFPRRIGGSYAMIGRQDNENLHLLWSTDRFTWNDGQILLRPQFPWEFVQLGNCGSPVDLGDYWLLLTHGVGSMRQYVIAAVLLDKEDPSRVIARSREPLIRTEGAEREGYVPNVAYTCGTMQCGEQIVIPYGVSDTFTRFANVSRTELLGSLVG